MTTKVTGDLIATDTITASNIAADAVDSSEIKASAVGTAEIADGAVANADVAAGFVVQVVNVMSGAMATTTTTTADTDSAPTTSHGAEFMTLAITPKSATNKLRIDVVANVASSYAGSNIMTLGLHQDAVAAAIAAVQQASGAQNVQSQLCLTHYMTAGTASATTFKVRIGGSAAGTTTFNGVSGARKMGGVMASSITITEIKA